MRQKTQDRTAGDKTSDKGQDRTAGDETGDTVDRGRDRMAGDKTGDKKGDMADTGQDWR